MAKPAGVVQTQAENLDQPLPESKKKIKLLFILWSLHGGGAERFAVHLMNHLNPNKFDLKMALVTRRGPYLSLVAPEKIMSPESENLNKGLAFDDKGNSAIFKPLQLLRGSLLAPWSIQKMIRQSQPDVILSFCKGTSIATMAALWMIPGRSFRWIAREGNNIMAVIRDEAKNPLLRWLVTRLTFLCYRSVDCLLSVTEEMGKWVQNRIHLQDHQFKSIFNGIDFDLIQKKKSEDILLPTEREFILGIGRLGYQKAFEVMIRAFSESKIKSDTDLVILGQGPDEMLLKRLAEDLGVAKQVHFMGWQKNPYAWMYRSKAFISTSRWEGCPNAVLEAMASGCCVIASNCEFGQTELIHDQKSGLIFPVDDWKALANRLDQINVKPELLETLKEGAFERSKEFRLDKIVKQYEQMFEEQAELRSSAL